MSTSRKLREIANEMRCAPGYVDRMRAGAELDQIAYELELREREAVAETGVAPDSRSYPFLALARRHGLDYGMVLCAVDHETKRLRRSGVHDSDARHTPYEIAAVEALRSCTRAAAEIRYEVATLLKQQRGEQR